MRTVGAAFVAEREVRPWPWPPLLQRPRKTRPVHLAFAAQNPSKAPVQDIWPGVEPDENLFTLDRWQPSSLAMSRNVKPIQSAARPGHWTKSHG